MPGGGYGGGTLGGDHGGATPTGDYGGATPSGDYGVMPGGDYGLPAPGGPGAPWTPPVVPPRSKKPSLPVPPKPKPKPKPAPAPAPGDGVSLAAFAAEELARLRTSDGQEVWLRAGLLTALSERIRLQLAAWQLANEPAEARNTLGTLSTELAVPIAEPTEVDRRWQKALATLESLATGVAGGSGGSGRSSKPFWKR